MSKSVFICSYEAIEKCLRRYPSQANIYCNKCEVLNHSELFA